LKFQANDVIPIQEKVVILANRSELLLQTMAMSCDPIQLANASLEIHPYCNLDN
jgi:hypothetical protein